MPGIVGLQTRMSREWAEMQLKRMLETVQHESFYVTGTWVDETMGLYVGWTEREESFSGRMPLRNDRGDLRLIFSGEEFSEPVCAQVHASNYLIQLAESSANYPACLNGRFHGLLANSAHETIMLFNDRYGMHRLYCHESGDGFYFAAEAKAILAVRPELRRIDPRSFGEYVTCGCVLGNRALFDKIEVLPGASKWILKNGVVVERGTYFHPREWEGQEVLDSEQYCENLRDTFTRRLPRYFADGRIGLSLTGGLDTRMILACHKPLGGSLPCYTFGGMYRDCQDVVVARQVASVCGQPHEVIKVGEEFLSRFHHYAERAVYLTDGCVDVRHASDLYLNERARTIAPIRMTGNYGSEVLRGVRAFKPSRPLSGLFSQDALPYFGQAEETYQSLLLEHPVSFAVFKQAPWHHYGLLALEQTQVSVRSPYLDNDLVQTVFRAPKSTFATYDVCLNLIADGSPALRGIPTDRGVGRMGLVGKGLQKWEEVLVKAEYAYDYGMPQWLARLNHALSALHLERLFLGRHKFNHYRVWYQIALGDYVKEILLDPRTLSRPYVQRRQIEALVQAHLSGSRNYTNEIHIMLTLELLHRALVDA
jgi:asparagine synthase (glutamine-hydrolysing)